MIFLCTFIKKKIKKIKRCSIFRAIGIKKKISHGSTRCTLTSTATQPVRVHHFRQAQSRLSWTNQMAHVMLVFFWHTVIYKIIILDKEVTTVPKSTTMNSKVHTETSQTATSCRCDQAWKAKQPHVPYNLNSQKSSTSPSLPENQAGAGGYVISSLNTAIKSTV